MHTPTTAREDLHINPTGEAIHVVAGYLGTDATDRRARDLASAWATSVADAFGHRPSDQLNAQDRARLLAWLDEHGRDTLLAVALDPTTRLTGDGEPVFEHAEPVRAAGSGATITRQTMHTGSDQQQHLLLDIDDEPLTADHARELAAALLFSADQIDGRASAVTTTQPRAHR